MSTEFENEHIGEALHELAKAAFHLTRITGEQNNSMLAICKAVQVLAGIGYVKNGLAPELMFTTIDGNDLPGSPRGSWHAGCSAHGPPTPRPDKRVVEGGP